jgi:hypothetical protein
MKNPRTLVVCVCISLLSLYATAQTPIPNEPDYNKPLAFGNLPEIIPVSVSNLNDLINAKTGASIITTFSNDVTTAPFAGTVVSAVSKYDDKMQTVFIKSSNYNGATLYISKVIDSEGVIKYNGRMMTDFKHGDIYVLQQKEGDFSLVKKNFYKVINE